MHARGTIVARRIFRRLSRHSLLLVVLLLALMLVLWNETGLGLLSLGLHYTPDGVVIERRLLEDDGVLTLAQIVIKELLVTNTHEVIRRAVLLIVHLHG